jgi:membrane protein DedA with SNARE-associated domain
VELRPLFHQYGYWAVFGAILLEDFGLPVPGEALLIAGAVLASDGDLHIIPLLLTAWIAAVVGDNVGFAIGRYGGRPLILRYGRYVFVNQKRLGYAEGFFIRHGGAVVIFARFFEILRQLNGVVAGIAKMPWQRFLPYNALGAALWVGLWGTLSYALGSKVELFIKFFRKFEVLVVTGAVLVFLGLVAYFFVQKK